MKCKKPVEVKDPQDVIMKNGRKALSGVCPDCGTKVFKIVGKDK
jgi:predicted  nucleic acid-binding Zn-ribbon protein